ncbi:MAG: DNA translocase FtsK 4TM domain-containing protein, partial [Bacteroidota bacterium]
MATTARSTSRKRSSSSKKRTSKAPRVATARKQEVLGLILMVLSVLFMLAVVTYSPEDRALALDFSWERALFPGNNSASNALGLVGAALSYTVIHHTLGYATLLLAALGAVWGYVIFRHRRPSALPMLSVLTGVGTVLLACLIGWFGRALDTDLLLWSGGAGDSAAGWMTRLFGLPGSLILLLLGLAVTVLLVVDRDIQRTID